MIDNADLRAILAGATDLSVVAEVYASNTEPAADGFDPDDAVARFAAISGVTYMGNAYQSLVRRFGSIQRSITGEVNSASIEFSNLNGELSQFEFTGDGFEGKILVVRLISRTLSVSLGTSQILFVGRCEKPKSGSKESFSVTAKHILDLAEVVVPRRKFAKDDQDGRVPTDPEFEGFLFMPQYGTVSYSIRKKRGGILGWLGFKKTVQKTLQYSSYSDLDSNKYVPEAFGRVQMQGVHIGYVDVGSAIRLRTAFCEGEIEDFVNVRSIDPKFPLSPTSYAECYGKVGALNVDDPTWVAPGNYSRTAYIRSQANNSDVEETDPAPDVVGVVFARIVAVPDGAGGWTDTAWSDNAAAAAYFYITSPDYRGLDPAWIDDAAATESFEFNAEQIFNTSVNDFIFAEEG